MLRLLFEICFSRLLSGTSEPTPTVWSLSRPAGLVHGFESRPRTPLPSHSSAMALLTRSRSSTPVEPWASSTLITRLYEVSSLFCFPLVFLEFHFLLSIILLCLRDFYMCLFSRLRTELRRTSSRESSPSCSSFCRTASFPNPRPMGLSPSAQVAVRSTDWRKTGCQWSPIPSAPM